MSVGEAVLHLLSSLDRLFSHFYSSASDLAVFLAACLLAVLYFFPYAVAIWRGHRNQVPILLTTLFFGWTFIGWAVALIWATTANTQATKT